MKDKKFVEPLPEFNVCLGRAQVAGFAGPGLQSYTKHEFLLYGVRSGLVVEAQVLQDRGYRQYGAITFRVYSPRVHPAASM